MATLKVLTYPDSFLKTNADPVQDFDDSLKRLATDMIETMYASAGIGLAATQVGENKRLFVIDVHHKADDPENEPNATIIINPEIIQALGEVSTEEGCLSVPEYRAEVKRHEKITVKYQDLENQEQELSTDGLEAICIQHELDHLNGALFIDHLPLLRRRIIQNKLKKRAR